MDPKGDRLRKIQSGLLKLPDSVLKSNSIVLTTEKPARGGGGCLEGGPRPRPTKLEDAVGATQTKTPVIIPTGNNSMTLSAAEIPLPSPSPEKPLPSHADIPLPDDGDIPLPSADMVNIPLPSDPLEKINHDDIPLPSNDIIPLPADKPQRKIKVTLPHLEPRGDELLCRSCVMTFSKQIEYDIHLQSDAHQQAIKSDLPEVIGPGVSLLNKRPEKSQSHDGKSGHVSFSFKKLGPRITNTQPFVRREENRASPVEIKLLKPETEKDDISAVEEVVDEQKEVTDNGNKIDGENGIEKGNGKSEIDGICIPENRLLMSDFVKVQSKDDSGRALDWPKEMIQYTDVEPKLMFSCNPLSFDFSQLFAIKKQSKAENNVNDDSVKEQVIGDPEQNVIEEQIDGIQKVDNEEKKKSRKKKKKKKHKKHKSNKEAKEGDEAAETGKPEEEGTTSKKKKKKHKRKHEDKEGDTTKESVELNSENADEKDKEKKSKKKKKKSKQSDVDGEKVDDDDKKHKKKKKKKSKKKKKKHHGESDKEEKSDVEKDKEKGDSGDSGKESDAEKKEKESKKKRKKRKKHKRKEGDENESSESETEKVEPVQAEAVPNAAAITSISVKKRKFPECDSDGESEKIVAKIQALNRTKIVTKQTPVNNPVMPKRIKKEPVENVEKKTPSERKRVTSESSVNESTPIKKVKVTPKASGVKDNIPISLMQLPNVKVEKEESWSKIETQTNDNVKSKWDTSDSDMDNALDDTMKKGKVLRKHSMAKTAVPGSRASILKDLKSPGSKSVTKIEHEQKRLVTQSSSQRSNKSNVSASSAKLLNSVGEKNPRKSRKISKSPASSHSRSRTRSRGRRRSYSVSESSSRSRSRSYSSSSDYSDESRHSRHRRSRRSSSRSYSRSSSRSRSRSYHRRRRRSSSSDYSRSRSYSSSRSRSRSHRRSKRSYTRSRSRSYSSSSSSYSSRSRNRYRNKSRRKNRRRRKRVSRGRSLSKSPIEKSVTKKKEEKEVKEKVKEEKEKVDPSDIPLPDLSGKKDDERSEEKLKKLKEKTRRVDAGETVAKLVSLTADIPLPFIEGVTKTVSSDSLPSGPPSEALKENDSGFIGPKMPAPPPPPPMGRGFPPNHGPPGPPRPGWGGQWDHWDAPGPWDGMGPWDGPGPRPPYRGMRPPYDPRMYGPYDPRRRGPPPFMNRPRGPHPYMGPRYPGPSGPHGPHLDYLEYGYDYGGEYEHTNTEEEPTKNTSSTPPPLPKEPPKESSPKPPLPKKKVKEQEPEQNPDIVIPPEQAEQYKHLQKQAQKHARRQLRRQAKKDLGEPDEDSTSSESEPEEQPTPEILEEVAVVEEAPTAQLVVPQQVVLQPQPTGSPSGAYIIVSGGQQYIVQKPQFVQAGAHLQAGQPVMVSQGTILATAQAAASGAHPAHIVQQVPALSGHPMIAAPTHITAGGVPVAMASAASIQHMQQVQQIQQIQQMQQMQQMQQIQQIQQAQAIQAHNQAVAAHAAAQHGSIVVGGRILVPTLGVRPAL